MHKELFLDANAHLPINSKALKAYIDFSNSKAGHGHPASLSEPGRLAAIALEDARAKIASLIGATSAGQIIFTTNCTQACEWAMQIFSRMAQEIFVSPIEHPAVKDAADKYISNKYVLPVSSDGEINFGTYKNVVCVHMQNEIGVIEPIERLNANCLFSDMSQSLGKIKLDVSKLNVDVAVFGGHKFGGPGGVGFIYLKEPITWKAFGTGSRYFMDRPGTPDVAGIVSTVVALEEAINTLEERQNNMKLFQDTLETGLTHRGYEIVGKSAKRAKNTTFVNIPSKAMVAVMQLGERGMHIGLGSACGSMHSGSSPLIKALGRTGSNNDYIRISQWGEYDQDDAKHFLDTLDSLRL